VRVNMSVRTNSWELARVRFGWPIDQSLWASIDYQTEDTTVRTLNSGVKRSLTMTTIGDTKKEETG
jgi:hypothetical protein